MNTRCVSWKVFRIGLRVSFGVLAFVASADAQGASGGNGEPGLDSTVHVVADADSVYVRAEGDGLAAGNTAETQASHRAREIAKAVNEWDGYGNANFIHVDEATGERTFVYVESEFEAPSTVNDDTIRFSRGEGPNSLAEVPAAVVMAAGAVPVAVVEMAGVTVGAVAEAAVTTVGAVAEVVGTAVVEVIPAAVEVVAGVVEVAVEVVTLGMD